MAQTNPLISLMRNLQSGRSSGAARVFRAAPVVSDVGQRRAAATGTFNADIAAAREGSEGRKVAYDDLIANLTSSVGSAKTAYESALPGFTEAATGAKATYDTAYAGAKTTAEQLRAAYPSKLAAAQQAYATAQERLQYASSGWGGSSKDAAAKVAAAYAALQAVPVTYAADIAGVKTTADTAASTYKTAIDQVNANSKTSFDTYQGTILDANRQQQEGYQAYVGQENTLRDRFNTERNAIEGLGYLAQAAPTADPNAISPSASSAQDQPDIYSEDIANLMQGRKQLAQSTRAASPEDDLVTGAMQNSIYSRP